MAPESSTSPPPDISKAPVVRAGKSVVVSKWVNGCNDGGADCNSGGSTSTESLIVVAQRLIEQLVGSLSIFSLLAVVVVKVVGTAAKSNGVSSSSNGWWGCG